jgi:hypothetical protein
MLMVSCVQLLLLPCTVYMHTQLIKVAIAYDGLGAHLW